MGRSSEHVLTEYRDHHATIFVPPQVAEPLEAVRHSWDPIMATQIPAHVTLAYPQEAPIVDLLITRMRVTSIATTPFRLRLGAVSYFDRPEGGIYVEVEDLDGVYGRIRATVLRPPFQPITFPPHMTLIHPRTSSRGREFWEQGHGQHPQYQQHDLEFTVDELTVTAFDGVKWIAIERFALSQDATVCQP